jgi:hypothetical protein
MLVIGILRRLDSRCFEEDDSFGNRNFVQPMGRLSMHSKVP